MNLLSILFDRVYLNIDETYDEYRLEDFNIMLLIRAVAKANPDGDGEKLYDEDTDQVYEGRTKRFIVRKVKEYIVGMPERLSIDENMADFVSLKQLKYLINAFKNGKKRISCYALIYLYVIYCLLEGKSPVAAQCAAYIDTLHNLVNGYFENHPNDQLAVFFHGCFDPVWQALAEKNIHLSNESLPQRPRRHPKDTVE